MNIVHVCLTGGYTEGFTYQENYLAKYHAKAGNTVTIITTQYCWHKNVWGKCYDTDYVNKDNVHIIRLPYKCEYTYKLNQYVGRFVGFYSTLEYLEPNLIFVHNIQFVDIDQLVRYKKKHVEVKIVIDNHTDFKNSAKSWLAKNLLYKCHWKHNAQKIQNYAEWFYGVLPARVNFLNEVYGIPSEKCQLLVMGADDDSVKVAKETNQRELIRSKYNIVSSDTLLMTGGKIDSNKPEILELIQAVVELNRKDVRLLVFGTVNEELKIRFNSLIENENVIYIGWINSDEIYAYFQAADLLMFPGLHSVLWEQAVGSGKACVFRRIEGFEHIDLGGNCCFFEGLTADVMKMQLKQILDSKQILQMNKVAEMKGMNMFSYQSIANRVVNDCFGGNINI